MWSTDELSVNANGGTEMMKRGLWNRLSEDERNSVNIICSRVREIDPDKPNILWLHDLVEQENLHLQFEQSRERFAALVFVSFWQQQQFADKLNVPLHEGIVIRNAIEPIEVAMEDKRVAPGDPIRFIYHTTPHRGLRLLVPAFDYVYRNVSKDIHLDVFSSFEAYGWPDRDKEYEDLFQIIRDHEGMTYHGYKPNGVVREHLKRAHAFAYPCIWPETSCIAMIEAMSAGCTVLAPRYAALSETGYESPIWYPWIDKPTEHVRVFAQRLALLVRNLSDPTLLPLQMQINLNNKEFTDAAHSWWKTTRQWQSLIGSVRAAARR